MIDRQHELPITKQAEVLRISRGSIYYLPRPVPQADLAIMRRLDRLHLEFPFAGSRMLRGLLAAEGCKIGRRHVKTLMRRMGIEALYRRPRTTKPEPGHKIYPYLLRGVQVTQPNQVWAMDITYIAMERGYVYPHLVRNAEADESLAEKLGLRLDIPLRLLRQLLSKATEAVRSQMLALAPTETKSEIQRVLAKISNEVGREATASRDFSKAQRAILQMQKEGKLNEAALLEFASRRLYEQMVAALSLLSSTPIDLMASLMQGARSSGLLLPCKAAGLKWPMVSVTLCNRFAHHTVSDADLALAKADFLRLSQASAQKTLRFWQVRGATAKEAS